MIEIETLNAKHEIRGGSQNTFLHGQLDTKTLKLYCYYVTATKTIQYFTMLSNLTPLYMTMRYTKTEGSQGGKRGHALIINIGNMHCIYIYTCLTFIVILYWIQIKAIK